MTVQEELRANMDEAARAIKWVRPDSMHLTLQFLGDVRVDQLDTIRQRVQRACVGIEPLAFEWSRDFGLEVPTRDGWRARFDYAGNVDQQISALRTIRDELARTKAPAQLIDVRFGDRPYFR